MKIILASSSPSRKKLLQNILSNFETQSPQINETPHPGENPTSLVLRLSEEKTMHIAAQYQHENAVIIGGDQVLALDNKIFGKPHTAENAKTQLKKCSGKITTFLSGICVYHTQSKQLQTQCVPTEIAFKTLSEDTIDRYIAQDKPFNCAGSFKSESLGVWLCQYMRSEDPNAIMGLPLIVLCQMLEKIGLSL